MSWTAKLKLFANQFLEDATHASNLVVTSMTAGVGGGGKGVSDHWLHVRTFFRDAHNHSDPNAMASRLPEVEAELEAIISLLLEQRPAFLRWLEDNSQPMPSRYDYILGGIGSAGAGASGGDGELDILNSLMDDDPDKEAGRQLITTVCQYAKHNIPQGSRAVILRFLTRFFRDVDASAGNRCLLHYSNDYMAMPLVDAIERIFNMINPWAVHVTSSEASGRVALPMQRDRRQFVALLHALSVKVGTMPSVAPFFMIKGPSRGGTATNAANDGFAGGSSPSASASSSPQRARVEAPRLLLIEGLVPFLKDYVVDLPDRDRIGTTRMALAGILSVARTPDPILREMLVADDRIVQLVTTELCHALVTAAKVPENAEFALNVAYVCDAVSFLDSIVLTTPYVARSWHIRKAKFLGSFLKGTVRMLLMTADDRVYANTAFVLALLLQTQSLRSEPLRSALAEFLFDHDPELAGSGGEVMEDLEAHLKSSAAGAPSPPIPSLFETAVLPRIHDASDVTVGATLTLVRVLMEQLPAYFMRDVLGITTDFKIPLAVLGENVGSSAAGASASLAAMVRSPSALVPVLNIDEYFPRTLVTDKGLWGSTTAVFANDVLRRMLLIESMLSGVVGDLSTLVRQPTFDPTNEALFIGELGFEPGSVPTPAEVAGNERLRRSVAAAAAGHVDAGVYCLPHLNTNPFIAALSAKFATFAEHPSEVNMELTGAASSLCLLPDCRIFYTLFDVARRGAFALAVQKAANQMDSAIRADKESCAASNNNSVDSGSALASSVLTYYRSLLAHTARGDPFTLHYRSGNAAAPEGAAGAGGRASPPPQQQQQQYPSESVRRFVEACVLMEGFRHEMRAIIGQVEVSLKLMELEV